ncbi:MAG TPA: hypothetical protein VFR36_04310 [Sphingomicrobium sp.]|nr:hypothetical protein [Sphingomicrobium sp.]
MANWTFARSFGRSGLGRPKQFAFHWADARYCRSRILSAPGGDSVDFLLLTVAAFALGSAPVPVHQASASSERSGSHTRSSKEDPVSQNISDYHEGMYADDFRKALEAAKRLEPGPDNRAGSAIVAVMRASALLGLKQEEEAAKLIAEAEKLAPQEPEVQTTLFLGSMLADRFDVAADAFDRMIARAPDKVREQDVELVWHFLRNEPEGQDKRNQDRRIALAELGFAAESPSGDYFTKGAIEILVKRGEIPAAGDLLRYIDEPRIIEDLLIQKRYSAFWPELEARVGPRLEKVRTSAVQSAQRAFQQAPGDHEKLQELANALRYARRYAEAVSLQSMLPSSRQAMALADREMGWAVNNVALALHESGQPDEADRLFALLNEVPMEDGGWRVSMIINRVDLLVADGKFDKAMLLMATTEDSAAKNGSAYAQQLVRRLKFCTMTGLGRKDEAEKLRPDLIEHAKDARASTIDGLVCAGDLEAAEELVLASLKEDEDFGEDFVRVLQAKPLTADDPTIWSKGWKELRARPAVAAEFERLGRDMPDRFLPPPIAD